MDIAFIVQNPAIPSSQIEASAPPVNIRSASPRTHKMGSFFSISAMALALKYFVTTYGKEFGALFAAMVIVVLPSIIVFIIFQERIISGLTSGGVKE